MASPMPRDSLGRIVYVGDVTTGGSMVYLAKSPYMRMMSQGSFFNAAPVKLTVDLAASPERTNYERYFADMGTRDQVVAAFHSFNCQAEGISCFECPFELIAGECYLWPYWLDERAVV